MSCSSLRATSASPIASCISPWLRSARRIERTPPRPCVRCLIKRRQSSPALACGFASQCVRLHVSGLPSPARRSSAAPPRRLPRFPDRRRNRTFLRYAMSGGLNLLHKKSSRDFQFETRRSTKRPGDIHAAPHRRRTLSRAASISSVWRPPWASRPGVQLRAAELSNRPHEIEDHAFENAAGAFRVLQNHSLNSGVSQSLAIGAVVMSDGDRDTPVFGNQTAVAGAIPPALFVAPLHARRSRRKEPLPTREGIRRLARDDGG
jgi:hypothetical protein